jgi:hypothetical protein
MRTSLNKASRLAHYLLIPLYIPLFLALAASSILFLGLSLARVKRTSRRYADYAHERRRHVDMLAPEAGAHPLRRAIDRSNRQPAFERRQSIADAN